MSLCPMDSSLGIMRLIRDFVRNQDQIGFQAKNPLKIKIRREHVYKALSLDKNNPESLPGECY